MWRAHPILLTFALGAAIGLGAAFALMFSIGNCVTLMNDHLLILWPTSILELGDLGGPRTIVLFELLAAIVGNAVVYGFVFAALVGLVISIRRSFGKAERPPSIGTS